MAITNKLLGPAYLAILSLVTFVIHPADAEPVPATDRIDAGQQVVTYGEIVYRNYQDAYAAVLNLQRAVDNFVNDPTDDSDEVLALVRQAWLDTRMSYGQTEAFRFYEGPIDFGKRSDGSMGPEGLMNAWPVNEAYMDYVMDDPGAGIINDPNIPITRATLIERNAKDDEADVTTGFHAIEFLLWGQDFNADGPGNRSARDFIGTGAAARRRAYLKVATDLLTENLHMLVESWAPDAHNYREQFIALDARQSISKVLTGIATLSGFELGYERLATALDSGSQEDEHSCFSDSTHMDVLANTMGVANVYFGRYGDYQGTGLNTLIRNANPQLNERIEEQLRRSVTLAAAIDRPFDKILSTPPGSPQRAKVEALVTSLQTQARLLKLAGAVLGVDIVVTTEVYPE
ncbi:MAG TPA: imelysin family protein [Steroidobacteraceae bacterium]|jgi:putative iron-regulated protein